MKKLVNGVEVDLTPEEEAERAEAAIAHAARIAAGPPPTPPTLEEMFDAVVDKLENKAGADQKIAAVRAKFEAVKGRGA